MVLTWWFITFHVRHLLAMVRLIINITVIAVLVQNVGMTPRLAQILGGCIDMMFMFGSLVPSFFLDRMGRRKTMFWGCAGLGFSMMMIAILLGFKGTSVQTPTAAACVTFFFIYMLIFGASVNCVPWVYVPEILPLEARAKGTAIGISSNWLWNLTIVMITPVLINRLQWKAYLISMATNVSLQFWSRQPQYLFTSVCIRSNLLSLLSRNK